MQVPPALFAVVVVGGGFLRDDADTKAVLPYLARIALDKKSAQVLSDVNGEDGFKINRIFKGMALGVFVEGRWAGVVFETADAANGFVVLLYFVVVACIGHVEMLALGLLLAILVFDTRATSPKEGGYVVCTGRGRGRFLGRFGRE